MSDWSPDPTLYGNTPLSSDSESKWSPDPALYHAPSLTPDDSSPTWSDHWNNFNAALSAQKADAYSEQAQREPDTKLQRYYDDMSKYHNDIGKQYLDQLSPAAQRNSQAGFMSENWRSHPFSSTAFAIEQQAPALGIGIGAAAAGSLAAGPVGGAAAGAGAWGAIAASNAVHAARDYIINQAPEDELQKDPDYSKYQYMSRPDARQAYATDKIDKTALEAKTGLVGAAAGLVGEAEPLGLTPGVRSIAGRMGMGAAGGAATGVMQTPLTDLALGQVSPGLQQTPEQIESDTARSAAGFGLLGGALGAVSRPHVEARQKDVQTENRSQVDPNARPGEFTSVGSPTSRAIDRKPQSRTEAAPGVPPRNEATGTAPPPAAVDDAQKAALEAQSKIPTPESKQSTDQKGTIQTGEIVAGKPADAPPPTPPVRPPQAEPTPGPTPAAAPANVPSEAVAPPTSQPALPSGEIPPVRSPSVPVSFPESRDTLDIQQKALLDGKKEVVVYPNGDNLIDLPKNTPGVKQTKIGKDVYQYRTDGDNQLTAIKIRQAVNEGKLNEITDRGPVTQEEAIDRANSGEPPVAIVERTADGTEVKTAAGTEPTAQAQVSAIEKTKLEPSNTVTVEHPAQVIAERQQAAAGEKQETPFKGKKYSAAEREARTTNNTIADKVLASHPINMDEIISAWKGDKGSRLKLLNKLKTMLIDAKDQGHKLPGKIKDVTDSTMMHSPASAYLHEAMRLVNHAPKEGSKAYERFANHIDMLSKGDEGYKAFLEARRTEAKETLGQVDTGKKQIETEQSKGEEQLTPRVTIDQQLKEQQAKHLEERRAESEQLRQQVSNPAAMATPAFTVIKKRSLPDKLKQLKEDQKARAEKFKEEGGPTSAMLEAGNYDKLHTRLEGKEVSIETGKGEKREPWPVKVKAPYGYIRGTVGKDGDHIDAYVGPKGETGRIFVMNQLSRGGVFDEHKVFMGFDSKDQARKAYTDSFTNTKDAWKRIGGIVEMTRDEFNDWIKHGDKSQEIGEGIEGEHPEHMLETSQLRTGKPIQIGYQAKHSLSDILRGLDITFYPKYMQPIMNKLRFKLAEINKDVPLYTFNNDTMKFINNSTEGLLGFHNAVFNHVGINAEITDGNELAATIMHEAFHAATTHALNSNPELANLARLLNNEVIRNMKDTGITHAHDLPEPLRYGVTSPKELLTEIISNPHWQAYLKDMKMSPELAKALDMPRWRRATLYQGVLDWFKKMLGLGPREYNMIEAAINIGERSMWAKQPEQEFGFISRAAILPEDHDEDGPVSAMASPKNFSKNFDDVLPRVKSSLEDAMTKGGRDIKQTIFEKGMRFMPMMDLVYNNEKKYGAADEHNPMRVLGNTMQKMEGAKQTFQKSFQKPMNIVRNFMRQNPDEIETVHKLLQESDFFNVHPAFELGEGPNKNIKPDSTNMDHTESLAHHQRLADEYEELSYQGQRVFNTQYDMLKAQKKQEIQLTRDNVIKMAREHLDNTIERPDAAEFRAAMEKTIDSKSLDSEVAMGETKSEAEKYYNDPVIQSIREANSLLKRNENGFYYPGKREGKLVVTGNYNYDIADGTRDPKDPNRIMFSTRDAAAKFVRDKIKATGTKEDVYLPSNIQSKYYFTNDKGEKEYVPAIEARNIEGKDVAPTHEYHVVVNNKHIEFMDNWDEGHKVADALRELGVDNVKNPVAREENHNVDYSLYGAQVDAFNKAIGRMQGVSAETKQAAKDAVQHVAIASMQGNRLSKTLLTKYRIRGASDDMLQTMDRHLSSTATHIASATYRPEIDKLLQRVNDLKEEARQGNTDNAYEMSVLNKEMENRINGFRQGAYGQMGSGILHNVAALGLFKFLFSPAHFALHLMHPVITSIPEMSSEHGWGRTYREMYKAYRDMGGITPTMYAGGKSGMQRLMNFDKMPTDFLASMKESLRKSGRSAATLRMIDELENSGYLTHNGMEFKPFYQKAGGLSYWADRSLSIVQELNNSAENINRVGTATAAFELAYKDGKGLSEAASIDYAKQVLSNTHGLYNNINRAPMMMSHPIVRSMLQFKTFPMMIYRILGRNVYNAIRGDTKEAQWQAIKALTGMIGTAAFFTGAQGATPEPFRLGVTLTNLLGLTDTWESYQDKITRTLASNFGPEMAGILQHGLGHVLGWDLHHRLGIDDLTVFSEPHTSKPEDVQNWMSNAVLGTPWGLGTDAYTGYQALLQGDYGKAINMLMPKALVDLNKAYALGTEGKTTASGRVLVPDVGPMAVLGQALGFGSAKAAEAGQARAAYGEEQANIRNEKQYVSTLWHKGDKQGALAAMRQFNAKYPGQRMTIPQMQNKETILGYPVTPKSKQELQERARAYGLQ